MEKLPCPHRVAVDRFARWSVSLLAGAALLSGCYVGVEDQEGVAWQPSAGIESEGEETESSGATDGSDSASSVGSSASDGSAGSGPSAGDDGGTSGDTSDDGWGSTGSGVDPSAGDGSSGGVDTTADTGSDSGADSGAGDSGSNSTDVPDNAYCSSVADWDPQWAEFEETLLELTNQARSAGANCGQYGNFPPAPPLTMDPALRCAARIHSEDMAVRDFFAHVNPSGEDPFDRMQMAGYTFFTAGENIAGGSGTPAGAMDQWMGSDGHCKNIMNPDFKHFGGGFYPDGPYGTGWTQTFGAN